MTASYTSPLVITARRFTAGRLLYSKDPRGCGKDTVPRQNFPPRGGGRHFPSCNLLDACVARPRPFYRPGKLVGSKRARCRRWKTDPPSKLHPWRQSIPQVILRAVDNSSCILSSLSLSKSRLIGRRIRVYPNFERERHSSRVTARHRQNYLNFRGRSPLIISADF